MLLTIENLIYMAGFFDGEGYICIYRRKPSKMSNTPAHYLVVGINNTNYSILEWFNKSYIGTFRLLRASRKPSHKDQWAWLLWSGRAKVFLQDILPYLKIKKQEAITALEFQKRIVSNGYRKKV